MPMISDKDGPQSKVTIRLTERQETILKEAQNSTGVSFGSLIRKCIDMNIEYLRRLTIKAKERN